MKFFLILLFGLGTLLRWYLMWSNDNGNEVYQMNLWKMQEKIEITGVHDLFRRWQIPVVDRIRPPLSVEQEYPTSQS